MNSIIEDFSKEENVSPTFLKQKRGTHSRICSGAAVPQFWNISWCQAMHPAPVGSKN